VSSIGGDFAEKLFSMIEGLKMLFLIVDWVEPPVLFVGLFKAVSVSFVLIIIEFQQSLLFEALWCNFGKHSLISFWRFNFNFSPNFLRGRVWLESRVSFVSSNVGTSIDGNI